MEKAVVSAMTALVPFNLSLYSSMRSFKSVYIYSESVVHKGIEHVIGFNVLVERVLDHRFCPFPAGFFRIFIMVGAVDVRAYERSFSKLLQCVHACVVDCTCNVCP